MDSTGWDALREEVCTRLEIGVSKGETEVDVIARLIWQERQDKTDAIEMAVAAALQRERGLIAQKAKVLQWRLPSRSRSEAM